MRIAVVGAEATGKTVLAEGLAAALKLPSLPAQREALLQAAGYHTLFEWVAAGHSWASLVEAQARREASFADGVVDGGVIDHYCLFQRWGWNVTSPDESERLRDLVVAQARRYDRIVVTPPRLVAGYAPARFRNAAHNLQLARLIDAFVRHAELGGRVCTLDDAAPEARLAQALAFVSG